MRKIITLILLFACSNLKAQFRKIEFQTELLGIAHYTQNGNFKTFNDVGLAYLHPLWEQTYAVFGLQASARKYKDDCKDCIDHYAGTLNNKQWTASLAARYLFRPEVVETWNIFAEGGFHYTRLASDGQYDGGKDSLGLVTSNRFEGGGFRFKIGTVYQFLSPWYIGGNIGFHLNGGQRQRFFGPASAKDQEVTFDYENVNEGFNRVMIEIRIGYRFLK